MPCGNPDVGPRDSRSFAGGRLILLIRNLLKFRVARNADNEDRITNCLLQKFISHLLLLLTFFINTLFISMLYVFAE